MALKTKTRITKHFYYRVETCKRLWDEKWIEYAQRTFDKIMKKVKAWKIRPFPGKKEWKYGVYYKGLIYIYSHNPDGSYNLITVYDKFATSKNPPDNGDNNNHHLCNDWVQQQSWSTWTMQNDKGLLYMQSFGIVPFPDSDTTKNA